MKKKMTRPKSEEAAHDDADGFSPDMRAEMKRLGLRCLTGVKECVEQIVEANGLNLGNPGDRDFFGFGITPALCDANDVLEQKCGACSFFRNERCTHPGKDGGAIDYECTCGRWTLDEAVRQRASDQLVKVSAALFMLLWAYDDAYAA